MLFKYSSISFFLLLKGGCHLTWMAMPNGKVEKACSDTEVWTVGIAVTLLAPGSWNYSPW